MAEGDLVQVMFKRPRPEVDDASKTYMSFWFDLFRVKDGKIVEHWDCALKPMQ
jgi:predicted SnoaL-like aldol condensation-catalyzing enzyme